MDSRCRVNVDGQLSNDFRLEGQAVTSVQTFKYLGTIIRSDGSLEEEFDARLQRGHQTMGMLSKVWRSRRLSMHTKVKLYIALVRSVLIYGNESWYDNEGIATRFRVFENKALRRILGVRWQDRVRNQTIREITRVPYIDEWLMKSRWRWLGHVIRVEPGRIIKESVTWTPHGTRRRGRPRPTWVRTMTRESNGSWDVIEARAQDRTG